MRKRVPPVRADVWRRMLDYQNLYRIGFIFYQNLPERPQAFFFAEIRSIIYYHFYSILAYFFEEKFEF